MHSIVILFVKRSHIEKRNKEENMEVTGAATSSYSKRRF